MCLHLGGKCIVILEVYHRIIQMTVPVRRAPKFLANIFAVLICNANIFGPCKKTWSNGCSHLSVALFSKLDGHNDISLIDVSLCTVGTIIRQSVPLS